MINLSSIRFTSVALQTAVQETLQSWQCEHKIQRLWSKDTTLWTHTDENQWMGWLNIASAYGDIPKIQQLAQSLQAEGIRHIILLGMGGASLFPAMLAQTFAQLSDYPRLQVLDSIDPRHIQHLEATIDLKATCFIVSSKSGDTLETHLLKNYFYSRMQAILPQSAVGARFIAITVRNTALDLMAQQEHFRALFYCEPSIGGRYSALSNFGIVPAGLMGIDIQAFLMNAMTMQKACLPNVSVENNPAVLLGVLLGVAALRGQDKVTFILTPSIAGLGEWLEQLIAESTGKNGKGLIPVNQEPLGEPQSYNHDRIFIYLRLAETPDLEQDQVVAKLEQNGFMVIKLQIPKKLMLAGELFRWEMTTAVISSILGINPFNQPDVECSKQLTIQFIESKKTVSQMPVFFAEHHLSLYLDEKSSQSWLPSVHVANLINYLTAYFAQIKAGDYINLAAFLELSAENNVWLQRIRQCLRDYTTAATCVGFGPRFLHSTGQTYKGGPNTGLFVQITADIGDDLAVPERPYSFGDVMAAQAHADFMTLVSRGRRIIRLHIQQDVVSGLEQIYHIIQMVCKR